MKYATWQLNFNNPDYGTGPEREIVNQGFSAEGAFLLGEADGGTFLGYFTGEPTGLADWNFTELTQAEALAFVAAIDPSAYLLPDGRIAVVIPDERA